MVRAVLFDLDDTLFDHAGCARCALEAVHATYPSLAAQPFAELARAHAGILETLHQDVLAGRRTIDDAREERFRRLFSAAGVDAGVTLAAEAAARYRAQYVAERRAIDGAAALLAAVRERASIAIVTNNVLGEQIEKLRACGLDAYVDVLVASEEAGVSKPDAAIFRIALERLGCEPGAAVMVGDSWAADIEGSKAAGIRAIWFNPAGADGPDRDVPVLRSFLPLDQALPVIFNAHRA